VSVAKADVAEERIASIIRVRRIGKLGTTLAVTSNRSALQRNTAENNIDQGHRIEFHRASILTAKTRYMARLIMEAIEMNSFLTISTERVVFVSVNHGSLLSAT
jgi:hypothetical protein